MIFDVRQQDLRHNARLVVGGNVLYSKEYTKYSFTFKYVSVRLIILIDVRNGLGIMNVDIGNALCMPPCAENIFLAVVDFGPRCGAAVVLKW